MGGSDQRQSERVRHRSELVRARLDAVRRAQRRFNTGVGVAVALAGALGLAVVQPRVAATPEPATDPPAGGRAAPFEELWVRGAVHILDDAGREVAVLGRERARGPIVLGLRSPEAGTESQQTVRLATSETGSAVSVRTPDGATAVTLFAADSGPEVELKRGTARRVFSERTTGPTPVALPAVGAARDPAPQVDLALPEAQDVGDGFLVVNLAAVEAAGGVRVTGRMINASSLVHRSLGFRLALGAHSETFAIHQVSPGNSTGFAVTVPGVALADIDLARFEYLGSTVTYHGHWARGHHARLNARR